jgi:hypothetical protein
MPQFMGGVAGNEIQRFLMQREMENRQRMLDAQAQQRDAENQAIRERQIALQEENAAREAERQRQTDAQAAEERAAAQRQQQNVAGVRGMMADGMAGGLTPDTAKTIGIMAFREGMDAPPQVEQMLAPKKRTVMQTAGPDGKPIQKAFTEDELIAGVPEYQEPAKPERGPAPNYLTLVSPDGKQQQRVADGQSANALMQQGWKVFDPVAARQTNAPDPSEAKQITDSALALAKRLYDPATKQSHKGIGPATGAWEMRGNWDQDAVDFNSIRDQLVAALALPNLAALKGPMSDKDILFVKQLATRLENRKLSQPETELAITEAIQFLESTGGGVAAPAAPAGGGSFRVVGKRPKT